MHTRQKGATVMPCAVRGMLGAQQGLEGGSGKSDRQRHERDIRMTSSFVVYLEHE